MESVAQKVLDCIGIWFNMDGNPILGRKVGLLEKYYLWCYFMDPPNHSWRSTLKVEGSLQVHARNMIAHCVPLYVPYALLRRKALLEEFEVSVSV